MGRLDGKAALVTGAGSGIGRASAKLFAQEGAKVLIADLNEQGVTETASQIDAAGGTVITKCLDIATEDNVASLIETGEDEFGGFNVIYANAGVSGGRVPILEGTADAWMEILRINLVGPFLAIKYGAPKMVARGGGSIICTASVAGLRSGAGSTPYSASKAGVISLVQTSANQLASTGVRVNAICPGLIETGMTQPVFDRAREKGTEHKIGQLNPLKRAGVPQEIANTALFLASDESSYVNGQAIAVDGGLSSSHPVVVGHMA